MYKVFLNDKFFVLNDRVKDDRPFAENDTKNLELLIEKFSINNISQLDINTTLNPTEFFCDLLGFKLINAAGGLVFCQKQLLCIFRNGKWDLPKGKIEKGESVQSAAYREVQEETGIQNIQICRDEPFVTYHLYKLNNQWVLKQTFWFEMKVAYTGRLKPQHEEGIEKVEWLNKDDLNFKFFNNTFLQLKFLIRDFIGE